MFEMMIGITFLSVVADIILTDSNYKKYIKSVIGIFTLAVIVQGVFNLKDIKVDYSIVDEIEIKANENVKLLEEDIKKEIVNDLKNNIMLNLSKKELRLKELFINIDENMNLISVVITPENEANKEKIVEILITEFSIPEEIIII